MNGKSLRLAGVVAALSVGLYAGVAQAESAGVSTAGPRYTARQMFEGIVFKQGPVAQQHPEVALVDSTMSASTTPRQMSAVELAMTEVDPSFFQVWGAEITSGDPYKAKESLTRMSKDFAAVTALANIPRPNAQCLTNPCGGPPVPPGPTNLDAVQAINYAVQVNVAGGVNAALVAAAAVGVVFVIAAAVILPVGVVLLDPGTTGPNGVLLTTTFARWTAQLNGALIPA